MRLQPRSQARCLVLALVLAVAAGGCGDRDEDRAAPVARDTASDAEGWMRDNREAVRAFDERLLPLGVRVARAGVTAGYGDEEYRAEGSHLAVYVEPVGPATADDYVNRIVPVARAFLPSVFSEHRGIQSFDVCQEPVAPHDEVPKPVTQLLVRRENADAVDWATADLATLVTASRSTPNRIVLAVTGEAETSEVWRRAVESQLATRGS